MSEFLIKKKNGLDTFPSVRPHHMLCLQFFEGKGYSEEFVENMMRVKQRLEQENPMVNIVEGIDDICVNCPNCNGKKCKDEESVQEHDLRVYAQVREEIGNCASWKEISNVIQKNIIGPEKVREVCVRCQWSEICFHKKR